MLFSFSQEFKFFMPIFAFEMMWYVFPAQAYNPQQLDQYNKTNQCQNCDLSNSRIQDNHSGSILIGANLSNSYFYDNMSESDLTNANASGGFWMSMNSSFCNFSNAQLLNVNFSNSNLENTNFSGAVVINANFKNADLFKSNITKEQLATASNICNAILPDGTKGECY